MTYSCFTPHPLGGNFLSLLSVSISLQGSLQLHFYAYYQSSFSEHWLARGPQHLLFAYPPHAPIIDYGIWEEDMWTNGNYSQQGS